GGWASTYRHRCPRSLLTGPHRRALPERYGRRISHRCGAGSGGRGRTRPPARDANRTGDWPALLISSTVTWLASVGLGGWRPGLELGPGRNPPPGRRRRHSARPPPSLPIRRRARSTLPPRSRRMRPAGLARAVGAP